MERKNCPYAVMLSGKLDKDMIWEMVKRNIIQISSYKDILCCSVGGVKKGAFTEEVAEQRFEAWLKNKKSAIDAEKAKVSAAKDAAAKKRLEEETEKNKAKAEVVAAKKAAEAAAKAEAEAAAKAEEEANAVAEAPASESAE